MAPAPGLVEVREAVVRVAQGHLAEVVPAVEEARLVMEAAPAKGHTLINKYTNDRSEVVSLAKPVKTPFGTYKDAVMTKEWTPDEPDVLVNKYYVRDIGTVRDVAVKGDNEEFLLVGVKH